MLTKNLSKGFSIAGIETCNFESMESISTAALVDRYKDRVKGRVLDFVKSELQIEQRYWAHKDQDALDLARDALVRLLEKNPEAKKADFFIFAGISNPMPSVCLAALLSCEFGIEGASCWDIKSGCSTGVLALQQAVDWFQNRAASGIIVCSETFSKFLNVEALQMSLTAGDGACAVYLQASSASCVPAMLHGTDAQYFKSAYVPGKYPVNVENYQPTDYQFLLQQKGNFLQASKEYWLKSLGGLLEISGKSGRDISYYFSHQVDSTKNREIALASGLRAEVPLDSFRTHGNMGCPTVFINFYLAKQQRGYQPKRGEFSIFQAVGGGLSWASILQEHL